jgi:hypothetical protein
LIKPLGSNCIQEGQPASNIRSQRFRRNGAAGARLRQPVGARQIDVKHRSAAGRVVEPDIPLHVPNDLTHDAQPEAGATSLLSVRGVGLGESLEHPRLERGRDAAAVVAHRNMNIVSASLY